MATELPIIDKYFEHAACQSVSHRKGACGACCLNVVIPPFQVDDSGVDELRERFAKTDPAFMERMYALGDFNIYQDPDHPHPCPMLNVDDTSPDYMTCTIYDNRPWVCERFTVGWDHCTKQRQRHEIQPAAVIMQIQET